ncbi:hypothetical protein N9M53_04160 [Alphaproteobacteria bacterium]|nr:hypothetical protein [Alphaproteobacteria bacterium]
MAIKFLLATSGQQFNMVSSWEDELYCSILKDGSISLRPSKDGEDEYGGRWWFETRKGIRTPKQFVDAVYSIDEIETSMDEVSFDRLYEHKPLFALALKKFVEIDDEGTEDDMEFFFMSQGALINLEVCLPENLQTAEKLFNVIYNLFKQHYAEYQSMPVGEYELMNTKIVIPKRNFRLDPDLKNLLNKRRIKAHADGAEWEVMEFHLKRDILEYCSSFFKKHKTLPEGSVSIGNIEVKFPRKDT